MDGPRDPDAGPRSHPPRLRRGRQGGQVNRAPKAAGRPVGGADEFCGERVPGGADGDQGAAPPGKVGPRLAKDNIQDGGRAGEGAGQVQLRGGQSVDKQGVAPGHPGLN